MSFIITYKQFVLFMCVKFKYQRKQPLLYVLAMFVMFPLDSSYNCIIVTKAQYGAYFKAPNRS